MTTRLQKSYDIVKVWGGSEPRPRGTSELVRDWERIGLNANGLYVHLLAAARAREDYEEERRMMAAREPTGRRELRRMQNALEAGTPLLAIMRRASATPLGDATWENLANSLGVAAERYLETLEGEARMKATRGRPGERWLRAPVIHLAEQLRHHDMSWRRTIRTIYRAFSVVLMDDVVTEEMIRHIIRDEQRRRRRFGRAAPAPCEHCTGPSGIGKALDDLAVVEATIGPAGAKRLMQRPENQRILRRLRRSARASFDRLQKKRARVTRLFARRQALLERAGEISREITTLVSGVEDLSGRPEATKPMSARARRPRGTDPERIERKHPARRRS